MKIKHISLLLFAVLIIADQVLKVYIKTSMTIGETIDIFSWFKIVFIENPGMAFGLEIGSKYILTIFRVIFSVLLFLGLIKLYKTDISKGFILILTLVLAGAIGNIIDCIFYGVCFGESTYQAVADFIPAGGGYAPMMLGKVVDMFYFPLFRFPDSVPFVGGDIFFSPVFNLADSYITVSLFAILLFYREEFSRSLDLVFSKKTND